MVFFFFILELYTCIERLKLSIECVEGWLDVLVPASHVCNMHFQMEELNAHELEKWKIM